MFEEYLTKTGRLSTKQPQEVKNQWYISKFKEKHGDTYDYSKVVYKNTDTKVEVTCREHGGFFQTPGNHLKGSGCPKCQNQNKQKDIATCISDFTQVHGGTYDYSKVQYVNKDTQVLIGCRVHGLFSQKPHDHLKGTGCPKCQDTTKTTKTCREDFTQVHGCTYDYSRVTYVNAGTKVEIVCKCHGSFFQSPNKHLGGSGCPKCQNHNQNTLYILKCINTGLYKIGITNNLKQRMSGLGGNLEHIHHIKVENPRSLEKQLHKHYKEHNVFNPEVSNGGTEFFRLSDQQLHELIRYLNSF